MAAAAGRGQDRANSTTSPPAPRTLYMPRQRGMRVAMPERGFLSPLLFAMAYVFRRLSLSFAQLYRVRDYCADGPRAEPDAFFGEILTSN